MPNGSFDIEPYKVRYQIVKQTLDQIVKDFSMFGLELNLTPGLQINYQEILNDIHRNVEWLLTSQTHTLMSLLYHIDVPESKIIAEWANHPEMTHAEVIAHCIIERELKKVIFRNYYKANAAKTDDGPEMLPDE